MTLETSLSERLRERLKDLKLGAEQTVLSFRLRDHAEYRHSAGYIQALDDAVTVMDEILADLQKE